MTHQEIAKVLDSILEKKSSQSAPLLESDWQGLRDKLQCEFSDEFKSFIEVVANYYFPGEIYGVSDESESGNGTIALVYDLELQLGQWDKDMIPFYGIGNGDYFCLNRQQCPASPVYYRYADRGVFEEYCKSLEEWIRQLPQFLGG